MKNLYKTKAYDLRDLNDGQLEEVRKECIKQGAVEVFEKDDFFRSLSITTGIIAFGELFFSNEWYFTSRETEAVNALELFELQIGDTFEYNGYICEVKEPIKRWVYDTYQEVYYKTSKTDQQTIAITNQQLIKLLEENEIH